MLEYMRQGDMLPVHGLDRVSGEWHFFLLMSKLTKCGINIPGQLIPLCDSMLPAEVPDLEYLDLHSVPHEYTFAMRALWWSGMVNGTSVNISKARKPEWVQENLANPLRGWDGREHITAARFKRAVKQFKKTPREVLAMVGPRPVLATVRAGPVTLGRPRLVFRGFRSLGAFHRSSSLMRARSGRTVPLLPEAAVRVEALFTCLCGSGGSGRIDSSNEIGRVKAGTGLFIRSPIRLGHGLIEAASKP
jgi:hypothetical protein